MGQIHSKFKARVIELSSVILISTVFIVGISYATSNTFTAPAGSIPTANYHTLSDIYNKLINFSVNPSSNHSVTTGLSPAGTFNTLEEIYGLLTSENSDLISSNIKNGVTIFGVTGNYTGSGGGTGTLLWTDTFPSLNIVGGVSNYQAGFGPNQGLCWSHGQFEVDSTWCNTIQIPAYAGHRVGGFYDASASHDGSLPLGATEFCDYLNQDGITVASSPQHYWRLPTQAELYSRMTEAIFSGADDPTSTSRGGFRNKNYLTSELSDVNYYADTPVGSHDSIKTVYFLYSADRKYGSPYSATREAHSVFRCVHTQ